MGADITFKTADGREWYFRDSYNDTNLAWVMGMSYWAVDNYAEVCEDQLGEGINQRKVAFFKVMANITDEEIETHVREKIAKKRREAGDKIDEKEYIDILVQKRDDIREHMDIIAHAAEVEWSV